MAVNNEENFSLFSCLKLHGAMFGRGEHFSIELTYNYGVESYNIGDGFNCMGLRLPDLEGIVARAKAGGGEIASGPEVRLSCCSCGRRGCRSK